ncbi:alpha/beta hydrolase family protein [Terrimonas ferruginea]|uniref:alpha/beta hydrolase family protein n=1 Tax=Terrimonas ferruginea TaxID=249 RepID=UPI0009DB6E76|nr:alpha/beta fold hydrolase [Terrimonas ferruginea]
MKNRLSLTKQFRGIIICSNLYRTRFSVMHSFTINTGNHQAISCSLYEAPAADKIMIIVSAAGVVQSFYKKIAEFFRHNNISSITFDYTGIGQSLHVNIEAESCSLTSWGSRDLEAVINHTITTFPNHKIILLGHSIGGQLIGLAPSSYMADKIILVAVQSGYWRFWKGFAKIKMWVNWHLLVPALTKGFGYLPSKKISRLENLPGNVAQEWAKWCRNRNYLFSCFAHNNLYFDKLKCNITSISMDDDFFAPPKSVEWLTAQFTNAGIKRLRFSPGNFNALKIGHFSLFTEKFRNTIWNILLNEAED